VIADCQEGNIQNNPTGRNRILVVSLQAGLIPMLRYLLSTDGIEVAAAHESQEMFEKLATTCAETLLLDLHLPTENAMRLLKIIRAACPQIFVITMAEFACRELAAESIEVGANGFALEPLDFQILRKLLHREIIENFAGASPQPLIERRGRSFCNYGTR